MGVSSENKALYRYLTAQFGASKINSYWDKAEESYVDLFEAKDMPSKNVTTWVTVGLSDASTGLTVDGVPLGVEFLFASNSVNSRAANIIATCAFNVINSKMKCEPGAIYPGVIEMYYKNISVKHILLHNPFLWNLETQKFETKAVAWLLLVPISDAEYKFALQNGVEKLSRDLEKRNINIFNLNRKSIFGTNGQ